MLPRVVAVSGGPSLISRFGNSTELSPCRACRPCESRDPLFSRLCGGSVGPGFRRDDSSKERDRRTLGSRQQYSQMPHTVSVAELTDIVLRIFLRHGVAADNAGPVAETVVAAERDGAASHGLLRLPGYVSTLESGWVDGRAIPVVTDAAPGLVATEAANGFAQPALRASAKLLRDKARRQGIAAAAIRNSHHFAAVWPDIEPFAAEGFIALAVVNGRRRMVAWDGKQKVLGTSPMAFACPRPGKPPFVWDQASSVMAQGEILLAAQRGDMLPAGVGLDAEGRPTTDPRAVLDGGSML